MHRGGLRWRATLAVYLGEFNRRAALASYAGVMGPWGTGVMRHGVMGYRGNGVLGYWGNGAKVVARPSDITRLPFISLCNANLLCCKIAIYRRTEPRWPISCAAELHWQFAYALCTGELRWRATLAVCLGELHRGGLRWRATLAVYLGDFNRRAALARYAGVMGPWGHGVLRNASWGTGVMGSKS